MQIVVEGKFVSLNEYIDAERRNLHLAAKIKKEATENVMWSTLGVLPVERYPVKINFTWYCESERIDPDNIAFAKKYILDGLVKSRVLQDDSWKYLSGGFSDRFFVDKERPRVEIEITEPKL